MNVPYDALGTQWPSSDIYAERARRQAIAIGLIGLSIAALYALAIIALGGEFMLVAPLVAAVIIVAVLAHPVVGVYLLIGAALLFEQFQITGLAPITGQSHVFQNISAYTPLPIRLSLADLLIVLTGAGLVGHRLARTHPRIRLGPLGWGIAAYGAAFLFGGLVGAVRGGVDTEVALNELRAPLELCAVYFLTSNLVRDRGQVRVLLWTFIALVGVKAFQGILNFQDAPGWSAYDAGAVTGHEDVVFFDVSVALALVMAVQGIRSKFFFALVALQPLVVAALFLDQRRVAFIAIGAVLLLITLLVMFANSRRGLLFAAVGALVLGSYAVLFWDATGPVAEPVRAVRAVVDPASASVRDQGSNEWRAIENRNIAFTIRQLPLTGVGLGQRYLFREQPSALYDFIYWQYITHNALLWLWLKAGPVAAFAFWCVLGRAVLLASAIFVRGRDRSIRWIAALPIALVASQVVFSSVDLGLTYSRSMIVLGAGLGLVTFLLTAAGPRTPRAVAVGVPE